MATLIKVELFRLLKSKQLLISTIDLAILAAISGFSYFAIGNSYDLDKNQLSSLECALTMMTISGNPIVISSMFFITFINSDMRDGTIRNKIISGYSRIKIFFSYFIVGIAYVLFLIILSVIIVTVLASLYFNLDLVFFNFASLLDYIVFALVGMVYAVSIAILLAIIFNGKVAPTMLFFGIIIAFTVLGTITDSIADNVSSSLRIFSKINVTYYMTQITPVIDIDYYSKKTIIFEFSDYIYFIVIPVFYIIIHTLLALYLMDRKDFK